MFACINMEDDQKTSMVRSVARTGHVMDVQQAEQLSEAITREESPYLNQSMKYFSDERRRFGVEILTAKTTFFVSDAEILKQLDASSRWTLIGEGHFGKVFKAKWFGTDVAVKTRWDSSICNESASTDLVHLDSLCSMKSAQSASSSAVSEFADDAFNLFEEYEIHRRLRHPSVVTFYVASPNFIVTEYLCNGSLVNALYTQNPDMRTRLKWALQLTRAVKYLHSSKIVHSDIKPSNVIFDEHWNLKLCDLGGAYFSNVPNHAKIFSDAYVPLHFHAASSKDRLLGKRTDLYALGLVIVSILTWTDDVLAECGAAGIERELCEIDASGLPERKRMSERSCAVTRRLEAIVPNLWLRISDIEICQDARVTLFRWIVSLSEAFCGSTWDLVRELLRGKSKSDRRELDSFTHHLEAAIDCLECQTIV